jgi:rhodanese-related sulfurtransferase
MRRLFLKLCVGGILPLAVAQNEDVKQLTTEELRKMVQSGKKYFYLDVREPKELTEQGAIKGYVNIPIGELEKRMSEIPKDAVIITMCRRGVRAARAAAMLQKAGYKTVGACGLTEWREKGYEMVYPGAKSN